MGKLRLNLVFFIGLLVLSITGIAQRVSNVTVAQEGQKLRIQYELSSASPAEVGLYISENNGSTWSKVTQHLTGDVGSNVSAGNKQMVWDVLQARESLVGNAIVFKVKVGSEIKSVKIGNQVWMAENLNVDHYRNGDPIDNLSDNIEWTNTMSGACCYYENSRSKMKSYGMLYNWFAVEDERGLCPLGWHIPSDDEWTLLSLSLGGELVSGGKLKAPSLWQEPNTGSNETGRFLAKPAGYRSDYGIFGYERSLGIFWSSSEKGSNAAWSRELSYLYESLGREYANKQNGYSVRCVKD